MTDAELRKLGRRDLLELMLVQARELEKLREENERYRQELEEVRQDLTSREIELNEAGSIAEAALRINGIFELAEAAGRQYLENIRALSERQDQICAKRDAINKAKADKLLRETHEKCRRLEEETRLKCSMLEEDAKKRAAAYWDEVTQRLESLYKSRKELRQLLDFDPRK